MDTEESNLWPDDQELGTESLHILQSETDRYFIHGTSWWVFNILRR